MTFLLKNDLNVALQKNHPSLVGSPGGRSSIPTACVALGSLAGLLRGLVFLAAKFIELIFT